jgi:hypothetical protein
LCGLNGDRRKDGGQQGNTGCGGWNLDHEGMLLDEWGTR